MTRGLIAAYRELDALVDAIEALKKQKFSTFTVYTPTPRHEIEHALHPPTSKIRLFTLIGGLCGVTSATGSRSGRRITGRWSLAARQSQAGFPTRSSASK
jgi:hypothetical protein